MLAREQPHSCRTTQAAGSTAGGPLQLLCCLSTGAAAGCSDQYHRSSLFDVRRSDAPTAEEAALGESGMVLPVISAESIAAAAPTYTQWEGAAVREQSEGSPRAVRGQSAGSPRRNPPQSAAQRRAKRAGDGRPRVREQLVGAGSRLRRHLPCKLGGLHSAARRGVAGRICMLARMEKWPFPHELRAEGGGRRGQEQRRPGLARPG